MSCISFESTGNGTLKTAFVETAFRSSDVIGVGANVFRVRIIKLKSDFDFGVFLNDLLCR